MDAIVQQALPPPLPPITPQTRDPRLWRVAQDFEAVMIGQMARSMFETKGAGDSGFNGGVGEETWRSVLADHIGQAIAARGGIGLSQSVYNEMLRLQGAQKP